MAAIDKASSTVLGWDGWEHAHAYHFMVGQAARGHFVLVMPTVTVDGEPQMFGCGYAEGLAALVDSRPWVRRIGFASFTRHAVTVAQERMGLDGD